MSKRFGGVQALDRVSFGIAPGEVRCLAGENGSGKSTVIKILSGVHRADGGEVVLAGFYSARLSFAFPPAFMREARIRIAAQWAPADLAAVAALAGSGELSLARLVTHRSAAGDAAGAYRTAFDDPACLKMILDWRDCP